MLKALHDKIVVRPIVEGEKMYGNILIPDAGKERAEIAEVISIGDGRLSEFGIHIPVSVKVGDKILVPKIGAVRAEYDGDEYYIIQDREILAIVE